MGKGSLWRVEQQYKQNLVIALTRSSYHPNTTAMEKATASFKNTPRSSESPPLVKAAANPARPLDAELFPRLSKFMANMANGNGTINNSSSGGGAGSSETRSPLAVATEDDYAMHNGTIECLVVNGERVSMHGVEHDHEAHAISVERIARDWGVDNIDDVNAATAMLALKHGPKVFAETFHTGYVTFWALFHTASQNVTKFSNHLQYANHHVGSQRRSHLFGRETFFEQQRNFHPDQ